MAIEARKNADGSTSYIVRVRDAFGVWFPQKAFAHKRLAKDYEAALAAEKLKGKSAFRHSSRGRTFDDFWAEWSTTCRGKVSAGWKISQDQMYRDYIKPVLGEKLLIQISRNDTPLVLNKMTEAGRGAQTQIHVYSLLHKICGDAVEIFGYLESNPVLKRFKPAAPKVLRNFLKPDEARDFLEAVRGDFLAPGVWVMTYMALRVAELIALRWENVDLASGTMTVKEQWLVKTREFGPVKNDTPIRLPIPFPLLDYLSGVKPLNADPRAFVCPSQAGGRLAYDTMYDGLKRLCRAAAIPELSPHELRHTATELWVESGASEEDIRRLLNHSGFTTVKTYIHKTNDRLTLMAKTMKLRKPGQLELVKS